MLELELRDYYLGSLEKIIGTKGKQATDRKLKKHGYSFTSTGSRRTRVYTITALPDAFHLFKDFCIFTLGFSPNITYEKLRDFILYLFYEEDFNKLPLEAMEGYLERDGKGISRQTLANYVRRLDDAGIIFSGGDYVYFKVYEEYGVQKHQIITKEEYSKAWRYYFEWKEEHPEIEHSGPAYTSMYNKFGGVPRKQHQIVQGAPWNADKINRLLELITKSFEEENQ